MNPVTLKAHDMSLPSPAPFSPGEEQSADVVVAHAVAVVAVIVECYRWPVVVVMVVVVLCCGGDGCC